METFKPTLDITDHTNLGKIKRTFPVRLLEHLTKASKSLYPDLNQSKVQNSTTYEGQNNRDDEGRSKSMVPLSAYYRLKKRSRTEESTVS